MLCETYSLAPGYISKLITASATLNTQILNFSYTHDLTLLRSTSILLFSLCPPLLSVSEVSPVQEPKEIVLSLCCISSPPIICVTEPGWALLASIIT